VRQDGISVVVDLLLFCTLLSAGSVAVLLLTGEREFPRPPREETESILNAALFSAADGVGYNLMGYRKDLSGKTWAEVISEAVFLCSEGEDTGRLLLENLRPALGRHLAVISGNLGVLMKIECRESGFSLLVGEEGEVPITSASVVLTMPQNPRLTVEIEVETWWR
jgi:hypothetical protein